MTSALTGTGTAPALVHLDGAIDAARELIGGKGHGIAAMRGSGMPIPPAFALTTELWRGLRADPRAIEDVWPQVLAAVGRLEAETGRTFGHGPRPLLLSVRSGAPASMPGMMDTVLNLGLDDELETALACEFTPEFAADTRRRFEAMYRRIVHHQIPRSPEAQLRAAIDAVFASWDSPRARTYRARHGIDDDAGTAVVVQAMVFGNQPGDSGTGVLFTRNPMTGADEPLGEWLPGGQGEDVVSGTHVVQGLDELQRTMPEVAAQLLQIGRDLERSAGDVQDIEFTVAEGRLWLLQTRTAKRSAQAAVRLALVMADEGLIDRATAVRRVTPDQIRSLLQPGLQPEDRLAAPLLASGLPACPGVGRGRVVTDPDTAVAEAGRGVDVVLVRRTTSPDDVHGMLAARAVVTELGGATCHAAVVSRELGLPAVVGVGAGNLEDLAGREITVDGTNGEVRAGLLPLHAWSETESPDLARFTGWLRDLRTDNREQDPWLLELLTVLAETCRDRSTRQVHLPYEVAPTGLNLDLEPLTVLLTLRYKGRVDADTLARVGGVDGNVALQALLRAVASDHATHVQPGFSLTTAGRAELARLLEVECASLDTEAVEATHRSFVDLNTAFKQLITDWQLRDDAPNDHTDAAYDAGVLERLRAFHQDGEHTFHAIRRLNPRLARYPDRLASALQRVTAGDHAYVARPLIDSYHTVWFELHEDLILASGRTRAAEAAAGHAH